jgi:hypothetical protein
MKLHRCNIYILILWQPKTPMGSQNEATEEVKTLFMANVPWRAEFEDV